MVQDISNLFVFVCKFRLLSTLHSRPSKFVVFFFCRLHHISSEFWNLKAFIWAQDICDADANAEGGAFGAEAEAGATSTEAGASGTEAGATGSEAGATGSEAGATGTEAGAFGSDAAPSAFLEMTI